MARVRIPQYILRRRARRTAPIQKLPNEVFDMILKNLPKKANKLALLLCCRAFTRTLQAQKINVPNTAASHDNILKQIGSGGHTDRWALCKGCHLLRPTDTAKWPGGKAVPGLPEDYDDIAVSVAVRGRYYGKCYDWFKGSSELICPECYLEDKYRNHSLAVDYP